MKRKKYKLESDKGIKVLLTKAKNKMFQKNNKASGKLVKGAHKGNPVGEIVHRSFK